MPKQAKTMWKPSVAPICERAGITEAASVCTVTDVASACAVT